MTLTLKLNVAKLLNHNKCWTYSIKNYYSKITVVDHDPTLKPKKCNLVLKNGKTLPGYSFGYNQSKAGEIVFNTGMVGYTEALTDPSYAGQILTMTYPIIGNYGVPNTQAKDEEDLLKHVESNKIHVKGLVVQNYTHNYSHWNAVKSLSKWLIEEQIPGIYGIDTRMLTKIIRSEGTVFGKIEFENDPVEFYDPNNEYLIKHVSRKKIDVYGKGNPFKILAVDCGIKENIIRNLVQRGGEVTVVPHNYDFTKDVYDGLFISNGPGNPSLATELIKNIKYHIENRPECVFGICMGNQLIGEALGAKTYKLPFGNRGQNQPCVNMLNGKAYITSQNHGYAINESTLPKNVKPLFKNCNDQTNEGLIHDAKPIFTSQFHPEACGGPLDTGFLFNSYFSIIRDGHKTAHEVLASAGDHREPKYPPGIFKGTGIPKSTLILGSGGLSIGQAGEFDYSGSQAIKALKEENIKTILINPNIASVQTNIVRPTLSNKKDDEIIKSADTVYFLPITAEYVTEIIKKERPESILLSMGGQTALNTGIELWKSGVLDKYGVKVLGTPIEVVINTEDRKLFKDCLNEIGESLAPSFEAYDIEEAKMAAKVINYPVMIRAAYSLGGLGSGICHNESELVELCLKTFAVAPQVLIEKSLTGWKEVEYEVVRDMSGCCITVCNMENLDALGVHTGDSIVVAPSQTLSNEEYHMLRKTSINVINHLGIIGECNIQYALNPNSLEYYIIEVNARLSRSSALASKATSYPLAFIAAKLSLGLKLTDIKNQATKTTVACFEPSLDYIVTKIPRWDLDRFDAAKTHYIHSAMQSVGEVMAISRSFEESFQKALRQVHGSIDGFTDKLPSGKRYGSSFDLKENLRRPNTNRIFAIGRALKEGWTVEELADITNIDKWFLHKMSSLNDFSVDNKFPLCDWDSELVRRAKSLGFSDKQIGHLSSASELEVRKYRKDRSILPVVKQIDTMAAEFPVYTNYLYCTYSGTEHDTYSDNGVIVLGCGTYHIGSSVEFDWCGVSTIRTLKKLGEKVVMVNNNPETISTDFDEAHKLYFEELSLERVMDIYEHEHSSGVIVSMSGQIPNNLALPLHNNKLRVLGTNPNMIDRCENRELFSKELDELSIKQAPWHSVTSLENAIDFCTQVGYPCLLRPSYVLSGSAMHVVSNTGELIKYIEDTTDISGDHPVVITKFIENAQEVELDGISKNGKLMGCVLSEHLEKAGVHSGDATLLLPVQNVSNKALSTIKQTAKKLAKRLQINGPFNLQFLVTDDEVLVIECNLRASRSFPFICKTVGVDFIELATKFITGHPIGKDKLKSLAGAMGPQTFHGVKAPVFSWRRLPNVDPVLKCIMSSTGEVAAFGKTADEAYLKALMSSGFKLPQKGVLVCIGKEPTEDIQRTINLLRKKNLKIFVTESNMKYEITDDKQPVEIVSLDESRVFSKTSPISLIKTGQVDLVINIASERNSAKDSNYKIRRAAVDYGIGCITNLENAIMFAKAFDNYDSLNAESLVYYQDQQKELLDQMKF